MNLEGQNSPHNKPQFCSLSFSQTGPSSANIPQNVLNAFLLMPVHQRWDLLLMWSDQCWGPHNSYSPSSKLCSSMGTSLMPVSLNWLFMTLELLWGDFAVKLNLPHSVDFLNPNTEVYVYVCFCLWFIIIIFPFIVFDFLFVALK